MEILHVLMAVTMILTLIIIAVAFFAEMIGYITDGHDVVFTWAVGSTLGATMLFLVGLAAIGSMEYSRRCAFEKGFSKNQAPV